MSSFKAPAKEDKLTVITPVRMFPDHKVEMRRWMRKHKGRWENQSHFIRSALMNFFQRLEEQEFREEYMKHRYRRQRA